MVMQVAKEKETVKEFSEVKLPLPVHGALDQQEDDEVDYFDSKGSNKLSCATISVIMNVLLIVVVVILAVLVHRMKTEVDELRNAEVELAPNAVVDNDDDSIDVKSSVDKKSHDKIREMENEYGRDEWFKFVRCRLFIFKIQIVEEADHSGGWVW